MGGRGMVTSCGGMRYMSRFHNIENVWGYINNVLCDVVGGLPGYMTVGDIRAGVFEMLSGLALVGGTNTYIGARVRSRIYPVRGMKYFMWVGIIYDVYFGYYDITLELVKYDGSGTGGMDGRQ